MDKAAYTLTDNGNGKFTLTVSVDSAWMNSEDRVWPVVVDPAIYTNTTAKMYDTFNIYHSSTQPNDNYTYLDIGLNRDGNEMIAYFKFNALPYIPYNAYFVSAQFQLYMSLYREYDPESDWTSYPPASELTDGSTLTLGLYNMEADLSSTSSSDRLYRIGDVYEAVTVSSNNSGDYVTWDITALYQKWATGELPNYGIAIQRMGTNWAEARFYSSDANAGMPQYVINYRYQDGLESYWTFLTQNLDSVGSGAVNVATGNMVFSVPTMATTDGLFGFTPSLVYNSSKSDQYNITTYNSNVPYKNTSIGLGWQLDINETVIASSYIDKNGDNSTYYIWQDGDGTAHAFYPEEIDGTGLEPQGPTVYKDEDGLLLTLSISGNEIIIEDSSHTKRHFTVYKNNSNVYDGAILSKITDVFGNALLFVLDSYGRVDKIYVDPVDNPNNPSANDVIQYLDFTYNANNHLSRIDNLATGDYMTFEHSTAERLTEIRYYYSSSVYDQYQFSYTSSGLLQTVKNVTSQIALVYTYDSSARVQTVHEWYNGSIGQKIGFAYETGTTIVQSSGSDDIFVSADNSSYQTSDDILNYYTFDRAGRVVSAYSTDVGHNVIYGATSGQYSEEETNKLKTTAVSGGIAINYLVNGGFDVVDPDGIESLYEWSSTTNVFRTYSDTSYVAEFDVQYGSTDHISQRLTLPNGEYTLSLNCKTEACQNVDVRLVVQSVSNPSAYYVKEIPVSDLYVDSDLSPNLTFTMDNSLMGSEVDVIIEVSGPYSQTNATVTIDNVMLEKSIGSGGYNIVSVGDFSDHSAGSSGIFDYWTRTNSVDIIAGAAIDSTGNALRIDGSVNYQYGAYQEIPITPTAVIDSFLGTGTISSEIAPARFFKVSAMGKGTHQLSSGLFGIIVDVVSHDDTVKSTYIPFNNHITEVQYTSGLVAVPEGSLIKAIKVYCIYGNNPGTAYFDNISIVEVTDATAAVYDYTEDGKTKSVVTPESSTYYKYDGNGNLILEATLEGNYIGYNYDDSTNPYVLTSEEVGSINITSVPKTFEGIERGQYSLFPTLETTYTYNFCGLLTQTKIFNPNAPSKVILTSAVYELTTGSKLFGQTLFVTDENGAVTEYVYDSYTCLLTYQINPDGVSGLYYLYDNRDRLTEVTPLEYSPTFGDYYSLYGEERAAYTYDSQNRLSQISTGTSTYNLTYDTYGNVTEIDVGGNTLATYTYNPNNGKVSSMSYENGTDVAYFYDALDRIEKISYNEVERYTYQYTSDGKLHSVEDVTSDVGYLYSYDGDDRVEGYTQYRLSDKTNTLAINYKYDEKSRLFEAVTTMDYYVGTSKSDWKQIEQFLYDDNTDLLTNYQAVFSNTNGNNLAGVFGYDAVQRLTTKTYTLSKGTSSVQNQIGYIYNDATNAYGSQIQKYTTTIGVNTSTYAYTYDANGNITRIVETRKEGTTTTTYTTRYTYDDLNQLIREDNPYVNNGSGATYVYAYDYNGNRTSKKTYAYTTGTINTNPTDTQTYTYGQNNWGDLLNTVNGISLTYDAIGNPLTYHNGLNYTFTWTDGRRLATATKDNVSYVFSYNDEGIRTSKTAGGVKHTYTLNGSQVLTEQWEDKFVAYIYDENGSPIGMQYRTSDYTADVFDYFYFEKNLQGDIVAIYNASGVKLVSYVYDAWGNHTTHYTTGGGSTGAQYNPFRYRGYYYDTELDFYYLNSRYYDPNTGRFLNADNVISNVGVEILGNNQFVYCLNNPVNLVDPTGHWSTKFENIMKATAAIITIAAVAVAVAAISAYTAGTCSGVAVYGATIFLSAALSGLNGGVANEAEGNSFANGYVGGFLSGATQATFSALPGGVIWGGALGTGFGTLVTIDLNYYDPYSSNLTTRDKWTTIGESTAKATVTSSLTAFMGYASDSAVVDGAGGLMPTYTYGFGEAMKAFWGWIDDALVYIWSD